MSGQNDDERWRERNVTGKKFLWMVMLGFMSIIILIQFILCATFIFQKKTLKAQIKAEMESEYGLTPVETTPDAVTENLPEGIPAIVLNLPENVLSALGPENEINFTIQLSSYVAGNFPGATQADYLADTYSAKDTGISFRVALNDSNATALRIYYKIDDGTFDIKTVAELEAEAQAKAESEAAAKAESEAAAKAEAEAQAKAESEAAAKAEAEARAKAEAEAQAKAESEAKAKAETAAQ